MTDRFLPASEIIKNAYKTEVVSFLRSIDEEYAVLLYNGYAAKEELLRVFSREHMSASSFMNRPNGLEMLSQGGPVPTPIRRAVVPVFSLPFWH